ncbi:MAG: transcription antitermination factor NusB [Bacteroidota bacterium]
MLTRRLVRIRAMQALYAFFIQKESLPATQNHTALLEDQLLKDIEVLRATHIHYWQMMLFWATLDAKAIAKKSFSPPCSLASMPFLTQLKDDKFFVKYRKAYPFEVPTSLLKRCYYDRIVPNKLYAAYQTKSNTSLKEDQTFLADFFTTIFQQEKALQDCVKEAWLDEELYSPVLEKCVLFFIETFPKGIPNSFSLYQASTFKSPCAFYKTLVSHTLDQSAQYEETIKQHSHHWDIHRLVLLDKLLLKMALAELEAFPNQPKPIILNEYIEIAKTYSAPKSYRFINGLLDVIIPDKPAS